MSDLCVGCGMCCDGTMYKSVDVEPGDRLQVLQNAGVVLTVEGKFTCFHLPCTAFNGGCCTIYEDRPTVCREYRCLLLRRLDVGAVSETEANALVSRTMEIRDRVRAGLMAYVGSDDPQPLSRLYRRMLAKIEAEPDPEAARREHRDLLFDVVALRVILAREFEPRDSKSHVADELAAI